MGKKPPSIHGYYPIAADSEISFPGFFAHPFGCVSSFVVALDRMLFLVNHTFEGEMDFTFKTKGS
jgi:hypothetical protein